MNSTNQSVSERVVTVHIVNSYIIAKFLFTFSTANCPSRLIETNSARNLRWSTAYRRSNLIFHVWHDGMLMSERGDGTNKHTINTAGKAYEESCLSRCHWSTGGNPSFRIFVLLEGGGNYTGRHTTTFKRTRRNFENHATCTFFFTKLRPALFTQVHSTIVIRTYDITHIVR